MKKTILLTIITIMVAMMAAGPVLAQKDKSISTGN